MATWIQISDKSIVNAELVQWVRYEPSENQSYIYFSKAECTLLPGDLRGLFLPEPLTPAKPSTKTKFHPLDLVQPPYSESPEFIAAFEDFINYRKDPSEAGKALTPRSTNGILGKLHSANLTPNQAVDCLNEAMRRGWVSIVTDKINQGNVLSLEVDD